MSQQISTGCLSPQSLSVARFVTMELGSAAVIVRLWYMILSDVIVLCVMLIFRFTTATNRPKTQRRRRSRRTVLHQDRQA